MREDNEILIKIKNRFSNAKNYRTSRKDNTWKQLDAFDRGDHWAFSAKPVWFPKPVTNYINYIKRYGVASIAVDNLTGSLRPLSTEDATNVSRLQDIYKNIWEYSGAKYAIRESLERAKLLGTAFCLVTYDPTAIRGGTGTNNRGKIIIKSVDPANVYPDPASFSLEDARYVFVVERKPIDWILDQGMFQDDNGKPICTRTEIEDGGRDDDNVGEIYKRDYTTEQSFDKDIAQFISYYYNTIEEGILVTKVKYFANWLELADITLRTQGFPLVALYDQEQTDDFWGLSICEQVLGNQKVLNVLESVVALVAQLIQTPQRLVTSASGIDPQKLVMYGQAPSMVFPTNASLDNSVKNIDPPEVSTSVFNYMQIVKDNILTIAGITNAYVGGNVGSITTSGGVNTLVERATLLDKDYKIQMEKFIKQITKLIIDTFDAFVDKDNSYSYRVDNKDDVSIKSEYGIVKLQPEELQAIVDVDYDIIADITASTVDDVAKVQNDLDKVLQLQMQYQPNPAIITMAEYVKFSKLPYKSVLLTRIEKDDHDLKVQKMTDFLTQVMQVITNPDQSAQGQLQDVTIEQLAEAGVSMMDTNETQGNDKLGNTQQRQQSPAVPM